MSFIHNNWEGYHSDDNGPFEVFWVGHNSPMEDEQGCSMEDGWYWWSCSPGCLPDGPAEGPFDTSLHAWGAAKSYCGDEGEHPAEYTEPAKHGNT